MTNLMIFTEEKMKDQAVNARDLWEQLESKRQFMNWFDDKILSTGLFDEGKDYILLDKFVEQSQNNESLLNKFVKQKGRGGNNKKEYVVTVDTAVYLCVSEGTQKGKLIRRQIVDKLKNVDSNIKRLNNEIKHWHDEYMKAKDLLSSLKLGTPDDPTFMKALASHIENSDYDPMMQRTIKINNYLLGLKRKPEEPWIYVCMAQIWFEALGLNIEDFNQLEEFDLMSVMSSFALWEKGSGKRKFDLYGKQTYFRKWGFPHR